jgi:hypothetical protein
LGADTRGFGAETSGSFVADATCIGGDFTGAGAWAVEVMPGRTRLVGSAAAIGVAAAGTFEVSTRRNLGWLTGWADAV